MVGRTNAAAGGKQWKFARGSISVGYADVAATYTVSGLGFKPRMVAASAGSSVYSGNMSIGMLGDDDSVVFASFASTTAAQYGDTPSDALGNNGFTPNDDGFSLKAIPSGTLQWRAWGY